MEFKKRVVSLMAAAALLCGTAAPLSEVEVYSLLSAQAAAAEDEALTPARVVISDYTADSTSITVKWKKAANATGYRVYIYTGDKYTKVADVDSSVKKYKITGLKAATKYKIKVRAFNKQEGKSKVWAKSSAALNAITAPDSTKKNYKITKVSSADDDSWAYVKWKPVKCSGYIVYLYDQIDDEWVRVANVKDSSVKSVKLYYAENSKWQLKPLYQYYFAGGLYGYRFAVRPYTVDANGSHTFYAKPYKASEAYYNINVVTYELGDEYKLLASKLPKAKSDDVPDYYYTYMTSKNEKTGAISSTKVKSYVSQASRDAYEKFAKEHFGSDWTDAQKVAYTLNWINKNNVYDKAYVANAGGYFANVTVQKLGQCNSYNGAIAEMLTILGYKGHYLQFMDPTVRQWQHFRTEIKIGKKTYSFESGEPGWMWLFEQYDEVPLSKKASK